MSEDPTNCKLLPGCIDLKYLSLLIFKSVFDCWQLYRIMGLIGCLFFTGYKWNLWSCYLRCEKQPCVILSYSSMGRGKIKHGAEPVRDIHLQTAHTELKGCYWGCGARRCKIKNCRNSDYLWVRDKALVNFMIAYYFRKCWSAYGTFA